MWLPEGNIEDFMGEKKGKGVSSVYLNINLLSEKRSESGIRVGEFQFFTVLGRKNGFIQTKDFIQQVIKDRERRTLAISH